ncbi:hypothetical protein [Desulfuribacillus alkaliarsenatis]|uniref:hypothetical protein n=1 Tax=Desulfuribacillus alkaliarsenatis TaxID=766136 RepID=UPI00159F2773|nr:hypothetical protein [Desulfuribacillus alkaliarsenatis]
MLENSNKYKRIALKDLYPLLEKRGYSKEFGEFDWQFLYDTLIRLDELEREIALLKSKN